MSEKPTVDKHQITLLADVLKISLDEAQQLFETKTPIAITKDKLTETGVKADVRPVKSVTLELEPKKVHDLTVSCPKCGYKYIIKDENNPPKICEKCGIVFDKYLKAQKAKAERESIEKALQAELQRKLEQDRKQEEAEEAKRRRKRIEEEIRKKLGLPSIINSRSRLINSAIIVHVMGIVLGIGAISIYNFLTQPTAETITNEEVGAIDTDNPGIMAQLLAHKMLSNYDPSEFFDSTDFVIAAHKSIGTTEIQTNSTQITGEKPIPTETSVAFLDAKLAELKTNAELDQYLLIQIDSLLAKGNISNAIKMLNKLHLVKIGFDHGGLLIGQLWNSNQNEAANTLYQELVYAGESLTGGPLARIESLCIIGHHLNSVGRIKEAEEVLNKARIFENSIIEARDRAIAISNIASLMTALRKEEDARFLFSTAISALEEIQNPVQQLIGIAGVAPNYAKAGYRSSALNLLEKAISKATFIKNIKSRAEVLEQLAKVSSELSDIHMVLSAIQPISDGAIHDKILHNVIIGEVLADRLAQAIDLSKRLKTPMYKAIIFGFLGLNQQREVTYQGMASGSFTQAKQSVEAIKNDGEKAAISSELGRFIARSGNEDDANIYFAKSQQSIQKLVTVEERDRAWAILAVNKAQISRFNEAQADIAEIRDQNLRNVIALNMNSWQ